jgi:hypothetical protein
VQATAPAVPAQAAAGNDCPGYFGPLIIFPNDPKDQTGMQRIRSLLEQQQQTFFESRSDKLGFTAFFWVEEVDAEEMTEIRDNTGQVSTRIKSPEFVELSCGENQMVDI